MLGSTPLVATSAPQLVLDLLLALAWKTLISCLRETSCSRRPQGLPRAVHANKAFKYSIQI